eukprot:990086-Prymnesium_polylepis.1
MLDEKSGPKPRGASLSWVNMGHGVCANSGKQQPAHFACTAVKSFEECTALCEFVGFCSGVNFQNTSKLPCLLYIKPGVSKAQLPSSVTTCVRQQAEAPSAIAGVSYGK